MKTIKDLDTKKAQLKSEITEMEDVLSFKNPKKILGLMTGGISDQYLGKALDNNISEKVLPFLGDAVKASLSVGGAKILKNVAKKALNRKALAIVGGAVVVGILAHKGKQKLEEYRREKTAKSLGKLI